MFYQTIGRLRRELQPSAGLRSVEVLHLHIGERGELCRRGRQSLRQSKRCGAEIRTGPWKQVFSGRKQRARNG